MYSGTIRSDTITSLEPLVINLVEGIWMSLFLRSAERRRFLLSMIVRYVVVCRCMSLYAVILACHRTLYFLAWCYFHSK